MSTINDIAKMEEELAGLRLTRDTNRLLLAAQDTELNILRSDNAKLRGRIEGELMRSRELETILSSTSSHLIAGLAAYSRGRQAADDARQGIGSEAPADRPAAPAERATAPENEPGGGSRSQDTASAEGFRGVSRALETELGDKRPEMGTDETSPRMPYSPAIGTSDHSRLMPARSIPRQVAQRPLAERLASGADNIGRPHVTPIPDGPGFDEPIEIPLFLRKAK